VSNLIVVAYLDERRAADALATARRRKKASLIDLEDAVCVAWYRKGRLSLRQSTTSGAALWGTLIGLLFFMPPAGMAIGAGTGWPDGKLSDDGVSDTFVRRVCDHLRPGTSAIFAGVRRSTPDAVIPEISKYGGTVLAARDASPTGTSPTTETGAGAPATA